MMTSTFADRHLADIGRFNPLQQIQSLVALPRTWSYGQTTRSLLTFDSRSKPWQIKVRIDHIIDVEGYGKSKRYKYKNCSEAVRIIHACFETYQ